MKDNLPDPVQGICFTSTSLSCFETHKKKFILIIHTAGRALSPEGEVLLSLYFCHNLSATVVNEFINLIKNPRFIPKRVESSFSEIKDCNDYDQPKPVCTICAQKTPCSNYFCSVQTFLNQMEKKCITIKLLAGFHSY